MSATNFHGTVNATGDKIHTANKLAMHEALRKFANQEVIVTIEAFSPITRGFRGYYHKVVVECVRVHLSTGREIPLSKDQTHHILKGAFIGIEDTPLGPAPKSTKGMSTDQFVDYVMAIRAHAASEWGLDIPDPEK
jgi:hypothetical protein